MDWAVSVIGTVANGMRKGLSLNFPSCERLLVMVACWSSGVWENNKNAGCRELAHLGTPCKEAKRAVVLFLAGCL